MKKSPKQRAAERKAGSEPKVKEGRFALSESLYEQRRAARNLSRNLNSWNTSLLRTFEEVANASGVVYSYVRKNGAVTYLPYHTLRIIADVLGNFAMGYEELNYTSIKCYAIDLETGNSFEYIMRQTEEESQECRLSAPEGIAICLLNLIPSSLLSWVVDISFNTMKKNTVINGNLISRVVSTFKGFGVSIAMLEKRIGNDIDALTFNQYVSLIRIQDLIRKGDKVSSYFDMTLSDGNK